MQAVRRAVTRSRASARARPLAACSQSVGTGGAAPARRAHRTICRVCRAGQASLETQHHTFVEQNKIVAVPGQTDAAKRSAAAAVLGASFSPLLHTTHARARARNHTHLRVSVFVCVPIYACIHSMCALIAKLLIPSTSCD
jgi:hypothetical protein